MIRALIADDEDIVRGGLALMLDVQPDIEVIGQARNGNQAVQLTRDLHPDVLLLDIQMPGMSGLATTTEIVRQQLPVAVLILTTFDLDEYAYAALRAGANGFLLKTTAPDRLIEAVRSVVAGESPIAPSITRRLVERFAGAPLPLPSGATPPALAALSPRELDVLRCVARGCSNRETAATTNLSEATVKTYLTRILGKLGLRDRVQAVILAYETGLVAPGDHDG